MKALRRWSEEGASIRELSLTEASRRESPDAVSRARALRAALAAVGVGPTREATTSDAPKASQPGVGTTGTFTRLGLASKAIGIGLVAATFAMGILASPGVSTHSVRRVHPSVIGPFPPTTGGAPVRSLAPVPASDPSSDPSPIGSAPGSMSESPMSVMPLASRTNSAQSSGGAALKVRPDPKSIASGGLAQAPTPAQRLPVRFERMGYAADRDASLDAISDETILVEQAQSALARDPHTTIALLDRYESRFPVGNLSAEAGVIRVKALLALGANIEAAAAADAFCRAHPQSPYVGPIQDLIRASRMSPPAHLGPTSTNFTDDR